MRKASFADMHCSVAQSLEIIGEWWTLLIVRDAFLGVRRFDDIRRHSGIPRQVLTNRLATLVEKGLLRKVPYQVAGARTRHEYRLTPMGRDLYPAIVSIMRWGDAYLAGGDGPPLLLLHQDCGHHAEPMTVCSHCREPLDPRKVTPQPGPGATASVPSL